MEPEQKKIFYESALHAGILFGLIYFVLEIFINYQLINMDADTNPVMNIGTYSTIVICLVTLFGGLLGVWLYAKRTATPLSLGQGAGLGAIAGFIMIVVSIVLDYFWALLNPEFYDQVFKSMVAIYENIDMNESQKNALIDQLHSNYKNQFSPANILMSLVGGAFNALLNAISGMLGVKIFINQPEEF